MKKYKYLNVGIIYFIIHLILEVSCFYVLSSYINSKMFVLIALLYDFLAFVPQAIIGDITDKYRKINIGLIGVFLIILSLILFKLNLHYLVILLFLTIGNSMIHISGAQATLRTSEGKMFPSSLFVSGGAIGIIIGKLLFKYSFSIVYILLLNVISIILILISNKYKKYEKESLNDFNYSNRSVNSKIIIVLAILVVAARAFMSYGIPTSWNKTMYDAIMLYASMMIGKALGGLLIDAIGIIKTSYISTLVSLPFILLGESNIYISLIGIMFFSMTMAITLALVVSECKDSPGKGFGYTTIGLFLGTLPSFFIKMGNNISSRLIFTLMTILCIIILIIISHRGSRKEV